MCLVYTPAADTPIQFGQCTLKRSLASVTKDRNA
jgi:hypothetical protein